MSRVKTIHEKLRCKWSIIGSHEYYRYSRKLCVLAGSIPLCREYVSLVHCCVSLHSMQAHWEGVRLDSGISERLNMGRHKLVPAQKDTFFLDCMVTPRLVYCIS